MKECPKCKRDITDSYEPYDESVGSMCSGWYCAYCDEFFVDYDESFDDDVI